MSFSPTSVRRMTEVFGAAKVCMLIENKRRTELQRSRQNVAMQLLDEHPQLMAGPGVSFTRDHEEHVRRWIKQGTKHRVWTVDRLEDARYLLELGVEELTSNYPADLRAALGL
ncbi:glycerophosphodiester phosphodiesterase [Pseudoglutamicibacter cumminsii]